ncbi:LOW QUALITY PROTEIN: SOSS complex subunit C-like [Lates calcarifer]|uniref:SOSS complex subunit C n=1 Tax=Lates calcarifer TaxID=8187 RepID=A0AAJ8AXN4_LATCA|nr:LOW QUALITY PROTEIN: SOSS complex subunit C-like [Lates calcarifer]
MAANPPGPGFQNKTRVAILAELDKEKRRLLQNQSMNSPGANIPLSTRPSLKEARDSAEQQHIAAQQKAALQHAHVHSSGFFITQDSSFGNLILPVLPRLEPGLLTLNVPTNTDWPWARVYIGNNSHSKSYMLFLCFIRYLCCNRSSCDRAI